MREIARVQPVEHAGEPLLIGEELATCISDLDAERQRLQPVSSALGDVPLLVEQPGVSSPADQVTIDASALRLIPSLVFGHTLEQIARQRGLAPTLYTRASIRPKPQRVFDPDEGKLFFPPSWCRW